MIAPVRFDITDCRALVIGAPAGFGTHFARVLPEARADVTLAARRVGKLEEVAMATVAWGEAGIRADGIKETNAK